MQTPTLCGVLSPDGGSAEPPRALHSSTPPAFMPIAPPRASLPSRPPHRMDGVSISFDDLCVSSSAPQTGVAVQARRLLASVAAMRGGGTPPVAAPPPRVKHILRHCSGFIPANQLTAVMGGSGAGKTTLLNFLAHRLPGCGQATRQADEEVGEEDAAAAAGSDSGYRVSGSLRCNGHAVSSAFFAKACAYVPQQSILLSTLTPRESIAFASRLRLDCDTSEAEHERNTSRVLTALGLNICADTRVGDELTGGGLSGGEKRRVNVGVEIVTSPPLLCLDEPTTGLDGLTAHNVLESLRQLTRGGSTGTGSSDHGKSPGVPSPRVTVVASIHQPSAEMFALIDHLILLSGGAIVYCGPAAAALGYFAARGFPCPPLENPPEYFLDVCTSVPQALPQLEADYRDFYRQHYAALQWGEKLELELELEDAESVPHLLLPSECNDAESLSARDETPEPAAMATAVSVIHQRKASTSFSSRSAQSPASPSGARTSLAIPDPAWITASRGAMDSIDEEQVGNGSATGVVDPSSHSLLSAPPSDLRGRVRHSLIQLKHLTHRAHLNASRLPLLKGAQILQTLVLGLLVGLAFLNLGKDQLAVQNRLGCVYFIAICVIFANTLTVVLNFAEERQVFLREQSNRMYSVGSYFLARTSIELLPTFLCSLGMALICFWMIDSSFSGAAFGRFLLITLLLAYAGQGLGLVVACGIPSRMLAMIVTPLAIAPFILFTPYAVNEDRVAHYFRPVMVASPFWWGFTGLMLTFFTDVRFHCTPSQTISIPLSDGSYYLFCVYESGDDVLRQFNVRGANDPEAADSQFATCCGVLAVLCLLYRVLALLMLYRLSWKVKDATK